MELNGVLLVDKPTGMTSHDVVAILRNRLGIKRIGHAGTLDPAATGLLVILIGKATKLSGSFSEKDKSYQTTLTLGSKTTTADSSGIVVEQKDVPCLELGFISSVFLRFRGVISQIPPMVSAKKVKGEKLYKLARKGITIERLPVNITIFDINITDLSLPHISFFVRCSKGTYVRTLCEDIGAQLGCPAHMSYLRRISCGDYNVSDALNMDNFRKLEKEDFLKNILPC